MARTNRGTVKVYAGTDGIPTVEVGSGLPGPQGEQGLPGASGPGSTTVGNVVIWDSINGTVLSDGGIALSALAPKASPALTGIPTAPTAAAATNTTQIATTAMVQAALAAYIAAQDVLAFKGVIDCSANPNYPAADAGWVYKVSVAGKIGGASGTNVEVGDVLTCLVDGSAAGTQAAVGANWIVSQVNIDGAVTGPTSSVNNRIVVFNGTTGKLIADSGKLLPSGAVVGDTDAQIITNKTLASSTTFQGGALSGTYSGTITRSGHTIMSLGNAVTQADYLTLQPTDYGVGKPKIVTYKETAAASWTTAFFDTVNNAGTYNIVVGTFSWNGSPVMTRGAAETITGAKTFAAAQTFFANAAASATIIELGKQDGSAQSAVLDFHSSGNAIDYDSRIISTGGTGSVGNGDLQLIAATAGISGDVTFGAQARFKSFTVATLPSASTYTRSGIYVSDGTSNKRFAISDGTNFRFPDGAIVS